MIDHQEFSVNLKRLLERVSRAAATAGRDPTDIRILPVTKTFPSEAVEFCVREGIGAVGENRVQEAIEKQGALRHAVRWELIGHLQSNKASVAAKHFDCIHSVDSEKLLEKLDRAAAASERRLDILLQFNTGEDAAKFGLHVADAESVVTAALKCDHLRLSGLMTIAPLSEDPRIARNAFARLRELRDRINREFGLKLRELSMGMTDDLESAIMEGSTCVRVGSALFGSRTTALGIDAGGDSSA